MAGIKIRGYAGAFSKAQEDAILTRIQDRIDAIVEDAQPADKFFLFETVANLRSLRSKIRAGKVDFDLEETDYLVKQFEILRDIEFSNRKRFEYQSKEYSDATSAITRFKDAIKKISYY